MSREQRPSAGDGSCREWPRDGGHPADHHKIRRSNSRHKKTQGHILQTHENSSWMRECRILPNSSTFPAHVPDPTIYNGLQASDLRAEFGCSIVATDPPPATGFPRRKPADAADQRRSRKDVHVQSANHFRMPKKCTVGVGFRRPSHLPVDLNRKPVSPDFAPAPEPFRIDPAFKKGFSDALHK